MKFPLPVATSLLFFRLLNWYHFPLNTLAVIQVVILHALVGVGGNQGADALLRLVVTALFVKEVM